MARKKHHKRRHRKHSIHGHKHRNWGKVKSHKRRVSGHKKRRRKHGIHGLGAIGSAKVLLPLAAGVAGFLLGKKMQS